MQHNLISKQNIKVKDSNINATQFNFTTNIKVKDTSINATLSNFATKHQGQR